MNLSPSIALPGSLKNLTLAVLTAIAVSMVTASAAAPLTLTFLHVNDWDQMAETDGAGGAAKIATVITEERNRAEAKGGKALVTFGGDLVSPSVFSGIDQGAHMIALADAIGFDVAVVGNHEFDFGPEVLQERIAESNSIWLASNVTHKGGRLPGTADRWIVELDGFQIGFVGLVTPRTSVISSPGPDTSFRPVIESGAFHAQALRDAGADIVVALTHQELKYDRELLRDVKNIDIVLGGHDHLLIALHDGQQVIMKAGSQGRHIGILSLQIERLTNDLGEQRVVWYPSFRLRSTRNADQTARLADMVSAYQAQLDENLNVRIGETATEIDTRRSANLVTDIAFGNMIADSIRLATGADMALTNSGSIRGNTVYPSGTQITRKMVLTELPYDDTIVVLRLTGAQVREALEIGVSQVGEGSGRFPQVSGLTFRFNPRMSAGSRVSSVSVGGTPLEDEKFYTLATNDFLAGGGNSYDVFADSQVVLDAVSGPLLTEVLIDYIIATGTVAPVTDGRIKVED
ncbi:MAG: 5'-nucleotidase C-terminal domain-containing protein [Acidiferrobacterales bacterium]|nr:5'-nucleotidase C-terminal domain-containing protein [Acidiferrobacterales bacterium]